MSQIQLNKRWEKRMVEQPETSMGGQDVTVKLKGGREVHGLVLNCSFLVTLDHVAEKDIEDIEVEARRPILMDTLHALQGPL